MSRRNLVILAALGVTALLAAAWLPRSLRVANAGRLARAALVEAITASDLPGVYALGRAVPGVPPDLARAAAEVAQSAGNRRLQGIDLGALGDAAVAQTALTLAVAGDSGDQFAAVALGNVLDAAGDQVGARAIWQPLHADQAIALQLHQRGSALANAGDREGARELLEQSIAIDPGNPNPVYTLGGFYWADDRDQSVALYRKALAIGGLESFFQYSAEGRVALSDGDLEGAATSLEAALDQRPDHAETLRLLATTLDRLGRPDEALAYFRRAANMSADPFRSLLDMGQIFIEQGETAEAIQVLQEAATLRADRPHLFALLGEAYATAGQLEPARLAWQQAVTLNTDNAFYHVQLGDVLRALGDDQGAIGAFRRALVINPDSDYARRQLEALGAQP